MGNFERFKTRTDRIKEQLFKNPRILCCEALENIKEKHGLIVSRGLFYKVKSFMERGLISKGTKEECVIQLKEFMSRYDSIGLLDMHRLLNTYTKELLLEQIEKIFASIKNK